MRGDDFRNIAKLNKYLFPGCSEGTRRWGPLFCGEQAFSAVFR